MDHFEDLSNLKDKRSSHAMAEAQVQADQARIKRDNLAKAREMAKEFAQKMQVLGSEPSVRRPRGWFQKPIYGYAISYVGDSGDVVHIFISRDGRIFAEGDDFPDISKLYDDKDRLRRLESVMAKRLCQP